MIMSKFLIYLKLEPYLHQWLTHSLGNPVEFPAKSNENAIIRRFLQTKPNDAMPDLYAEGLTAICIPDSKAKPPQYYNYCGPKAKSAIIEAIEDLFRINLWAELAPASYNVERAECGLNKMIAAWCEMHGIDDDYTETVRQKYYRMRKAYTKNGVFLGKLTRNRSDDTPDFKQLRTTANKPKKWY